MRKTFSNFVCFSKCPKFTLPHFTEVMCCNYLSQCRVEFELTWLFTNRFRGFYYTCRNLFYSHFLNFHMCLVSLYIFVNNQVNSNLNSTHHCDRYLKRCILMKRLLYFVGIVMCLFLSFCSVVNKILITA